MLPETNSSLVLGVVHIDNITNDHHNYFFIIVVVDRELDYNITTSSADTPTFKKHSKSYLRI